MICTLRCVYVRGAECISGNGFKWERLETEDPWISLLCQQRVTVVADKEIPYRSVTFFEVYFRQVPRNLLSTEPTRLLL